MADKTSKLPTLVIWYKFNSSDKIYGSETYVRTLQYEKYDGCSAWRKTRRASGYLSIHVLILDG
jgi:hypothetical protein